LLLLLLLLLLLPQVLALEMLILLLENPSDDSVEMAVEFCKEVRWDSRNLLTHLFGCLVLGNSHRAVAHLLDHLLAALFTC
jgi:hypothetical protein